jgi:hypothetical protein
LYFGRFQWLSCTGKKITCMIKQLFSSSSSPVLCLGLWKPRNTAIKMDTSPSSSWSNDRPSKKPSSRVCYLLNDGFLFDFFFDHQDGGDTVSTKPRQTSNELHGVISHNIEFLIILAVKTSNPTYFPEFMTLPHLQQQNT